MNAPLVLPAGLHAGVKMADYLAMPLLSSGLCNRILQASPYHARHEQQNRAQDDTDASDSGTAIHDALLEGVDRIAVIDAKDWRTNVAKEARELARAAGKIPMLAHKAPQVMAAVKAAKAFIDRSELAGLFDDGRPEVTMIFEADDVLCKARPDFLANDHSILCHVKTTQGSAQPDAWIRAQLVNNGYDVAAAFYERGLYSLPGDGKAAVTSVFLVIEQSAPHGCSLIALDPAMMDIAERKVARAIATWRECSARDFWPAYPARICYAAPKPWQLAEAEEKELNDAYDSLQEKEGLQI